jgi:hypothetical protein
VIFVALAPSGTFLIVIETESAAELFGLSQIRSIL